MGSIVEVTLSDVVCAVRGALRARYNDNGIELWLRRPNARLRYLRPIDAILDGRGADVLELIRVAGKAV